MTTKPSTTFTCKTLFTSPCKILIRLLKLKKPIFPRRNHSQRMKATPTSTNASHFCCLTSFFGSLRTEKDMDRVMELKSFSDAGYLQKAPCPSPLTPACIKMARDVMVEDVGTEDGFQMFESYLVKIIAEEGKTRDLLDVEELLYNWKNLKSPVFINLACRFYRELCKDLFSSNIDNNGNDDDIRSLM